MPSDGGLTSEIELYIVGVLAALKHEGEDVFKTVEQYLDQLFASQGGLEKFDSYASFAFIAYQDADGSRQGDYDLKQELRFNILIGAKSKGGGIARTGDANHLGISKIRDIVIAALDKTHPGVACDSIFYDGEFKLVDKPKQQAMQLNFLVGVI